MVDVPSIDATPPDDTGAPMRGLQAAMKRSLTLAQQHDPDQRAREVRIGQQRGISPDAVHSVFESADTHRKALLEDDPFDKLVRGSRAAQAWMADPSNAAVARDDVDGVLGVSSALLGLGSSRSWFGDVGGATQAGFIGLQSTAGHLAVALGMVQPEDVVGAIAQANLRVQEDQRNRSHATKLYFQRLEQASTLGVIPTALSDPAGLAVLVAENLGFSAPTLALGAAGSAAGAKAGLAFGAAGGPHFAAATTAIGSAGGFAAGAFTGSMATEFGAWVNQAIGEAGYDPTNPESLLEAYSDPELMGRIQGEAARKGFGTALVDTLSTFVAGKWLAGARGRGFVAKAAATGKDVGVQSLGEIASEAAGKGLALGELKPEDWKDAMLEGVASLGQSGGEIAIGASIRKSGQAVQSIQDAASVRNAVEAWRNSKTGKRVPEALRDLMDREVADQDPEVRAAYVDRNVWDAYHRERGENPQEAATAILGSETLGQMRYRDAGRTGFLEFPLSSWVEALADTPQFEEMLRLARYRPRGNTLAELEVLADEGGGELAQSMRAELERGVTMFQEERRLREEAERVDAEIAAMEGEGEQNAEALAGSVERGGDGADDGAGGGLPGAVLDGDAAEGAAVQAGAETEASATARLDALRQRRAEIDTTLADLPERSTPTAASERLREGVREQLVTAGRSESDAPLMADMLVGAYETLAARVGTTVEDLWRRFPVSFRRAGEAIDRGLTTLFHPAYHGTPHRFDEFSLHAIGTGEGAQAYGWGLYFAESRGIAEYYKRALSGQDDSVVLLGNGQQWGSPNIPDGGADRLFHQRYSVGREIAQRARQYDESAQVAAAKIAAGLLEMADARRGSEERRVAEVLAAGGDEQSAENVRRVGRDQEQSWREQAQLAEEIANDPKARVGDPGALYEVDLAPEQDEYLDWDKPLLDQSAKVRDAVGKLLAVDSTLLLPGESGSKLYGRLVDRVRAELAEHRDGDRADLPSTQWQEFAGVWGDDFLTAEEVSSKALAAAGIPGIKYLDGQSRNRPLRDIKQAFLEALPEDATPDDMVDADPGTFTASQESVLAALEGDDWLGFNSVAQAISAALGSDIDNFDASDTLRDAVKALKADTDQSSNYVIFDDRLVSITAVDGVPVKSDTITVDGVERPTLNSEGNPIHSTEEGVRNFWRWFGDSEIVDDDGRPLVVYRGRLPDSPPDTLRTPVAYFAFDRDGALGYADELAPYDESLVLAAYVRASRVATEADVRRIAESAGLDLPFGEDYATAYLEQQPDLADALRAEGFDAARGLDGRPDTLEDIESLGVLDPNAQVKAIGNSGAFDTGSASILFQTEALPATLEVDGVERPTLNSEGQQIHPTEEGVRAFWRWFGDSKVVDGDGRPLVVYHGTSTPRTYEEFRSGRSVQGAGIFFAEDLGVAEEFAHDLRDNRAPRIFPVYLRATDPADMQVLGLDTEEGAPAGSDARVWAATVPFGEPQDVTVGRHDWKAPASERDKAMPHTKFIGERVWSVTDPTQIKSAIGNSGAFDPGDRSILHAPGKRGAVEFGPPGEQRPFDVQFYSRANRATWFHEMGHVFLEILGDLATADDAPAQIRDDYAAALKWMGVESRDALETEQHEKFARGFEAYIREGKAPSQALRRIFAAFKDWMVRLYRDLRGLNVELSDDVRGVMDRILATDDQIAEAQYDVGAPSLPAEAVPDDERAEYMSMAREARDEAEADLAHQEFKSLAAQRKAERGKVMEALVRRASRAFDESPGAVAVELLTEDDAPKIDPASVGDEGQHAILGKLGLLGDDGLTMQDMAEQFGFDSGDAFVKAVEPVLTRDERVERAARAILRKEHPELLDTRSIRVLARKAVANEKRAKLLEREHKILLRRATQAGVEAGAVVAGRRRDQAARRDFGRMHETVAELKARAKAMIGNTRRADLRPSAFLAAAKRESARAAAHVRADRWAEAAKAKRRERMNHELYREAMRRAEQSGKDERRLRTVGKKTYRERVTKGGGRGFRDQIDYVLDRFGIARHGEPVEKTKSLEDFLVELELAGNPLAAPAWVVNEAVRAKTRDLTPDQLHDLRSLVDGMYKVARDADAALTGTRKASRAAEAQEIAASVRANRDERKREPGAPTKTERALEYLEAFFAEGTKISYFARMMDGDKDGGPFWQYIVRRINEAVDAKAVDQRKAIEAVQAMYDTHYTKAERKRMDTREDFGGVGLSHQDRLSILAHLGNAEGRQRLAQILTPDQMRLIMASYTSADVAWVRDLWKLYDGYFKRAVRMHERISGQTPKAVEHTPFELRLVDGDVAELPGGYMPIAYADSRPYREQMRDLWASVKSGAAASSMIDMGFLQERKAKVHGRIRLDQGVITKHVIDITHMLTLREAVLDVQALLGSEAVHSAVQDTWGKTVMSQLNDWLRTVAADSGSATNATEKGLGYLRRAAITATLGFRMKSAVMQLFGFRQTIVRVGGKYMAKGMRRWFLDAESTWKVPEWVRSKSAFMAERANGTYQRELNEMRLSMPGRYRTSMNLYAFWMLTKFQGSVDVLTWLAQYEKSMERLGGDPANEAQVIAEADQAVRDAQGGGQINDLSWWEAGPPALRLMTTYFTEASLKFNQTRLSLSRTSWKDPGTWPAFLADMTLLYFFEAAVAGAIVAAGGGDDDDEPGEVMARKTVGAVLDTMPILRELSGPAQGWRYSGTAGLSSVTNTIRALEQIGQGEIDEALWKSINMAGGSLFNYPARFINDAADSIDQVFSGQVPTALVGIRKESD